MAPSNCPKNCSLGAPWPPGIYLTNYILLLRCLYTIFTKRISLNALKIKIFNDFLSQRHQISSKTVPLGPPDPLGYILPLDIYIYGASTKYLQKKKALMLSKLRFSMIFVAAPWNRPKTAPWGPRAPPNVFFFASFMFVWSLSTILSNNNQLLGKLELEAVITLERHRVP